MGEKITLTVKEMAEKLHVSVSTIYAMVRDMQIPHVRVRNKIMFHTPTIHDWLAGGAQSSNEENHKGGE